MQQAGGRGDSRCPGTDDHHVVVGGAPFSSGRSSRGCLQCVAEVIAAVGGSGEQFIDGYAKPLLVKGPQGDGSRAGTAVSMYGLCQSLVSGEESANVLLCELARDHRLIEQLDTGLCCSGLDLGDIDLVCGLAVRTVAYQ